MDVNRTLDAIGLSEETVLKLIPHELDKLEVNKILEVLVTDRKLAEKIGEQMKRVKVAKIEEREDRIAVLLERTQE